MSQEINIEELSPVLEPIETESRRSLINQKNEVAISYLPWIALLLVAIIILIFYREKFNDTPGDIITKTPPSST
jgi:hypothetical protein